MARTSTTFTKERPGPGRPPQTAEQKDAKAALKLMGHDVVARLTQLLQSDDEKVSASVALGLLKAIGLDEPTRIETKDTTERVATDASRAEVSEMLRQVRLRVVGAPVAAATPPKP